jgi:ABC-type antimicrobial peptide transport system permease subunit
VATLVFRESLTLAFWGLTIGLGVALSMTHLIDTMLFGITATDPITLAAAPLVLGSVALLATFLPVRRAIRVDPNVALRSD